MMLQDNVAEESARNIAFLLNQSEESLGEMVALIKKREAESLDIALEKLNSTAFVDIYPHWLSLRGTYTTSEFIVKYFSLIKPCIEMMSRSDDDFIILCADMSTVGLSIGFNPVWICRKSDLSASFMDAFRAFIATNSMGSIKPFIVGTCFTKSIVICEDKQRYNWSSNGSHVSPANHGKFDPTVFKNAEVFNYDDMVFFRAIRAACGVND